MVGPPGPAVFLISGFHVPDFKFDLTGQIMSGCGPAFSIEQRITTDLELPRTESP
jgi:hypothetical protein